MSVDRAIELFKDWMRAKRPIHKTGINGNANCMAKTLPLFQKFVQAYPDFWVKEFGYVPKGKPGQKSEHYITFTNEILGPAIEQLTGERPIFDCKYTTRRDRTFSIRAIYGWQEPSQIKVPNPNRKCRRLPIDDEMCECGDVTDVGEGEPDYDIETLKLMTSIAAVAETVWPLAKQSSPNGPSIRRTALRLKKRARGRLRGRPRLKCRRARCGTFAKSRALHMSRWTGESRMLSETH